jgi:phage tail sheath protein FI
MSSIFLVTRDDGVIGYDEYRAHVVLAKSPGEARQLCAEISADEGRNVWFASSAQKIGSPHPLLNKESRIILSDFNAG